MIREGAAMSIPGYEILPERCRCGAPICQRARHLATGRLVCLEVFPTWEVAGHDPTRDLDSFRRKLELVALLDHPGILPILAVDRFDTSFYLVRPVVEGDFLDEVLNRQAVDGRQAARWTRTAADTVRHAHEHGIFHPDLTVHEVFLTHQGNVLLTRFEDALVRFLHPPAPTEWPEPGAILGTPATMAPEEIRGEAPRYCPRRDIWALGTLLFQLAVGRRPFEGSGALEILRAVLESPLPRPRSLRPDLEADLEAIIVRCLRKRPEDRYPEVPLLLADLDSYLADRPLCHAQQPTLTGRMGRWIRGLWGAAQPSG